MSSYYHAKRDAIPYKSTPYQSFPTLEPPALLRHGGGVWEQYYVRWMMIRVIQPTNRLKSKKEISEGNQP